MKIEENLKYWIKDLVKQIMSEAPGDEDEPVVDDVEPESTDNIPSPLPDEPSPEETEVEPESPVNVFGSGPQPDISEPISPEPEEPKSDSDVSPPTNNIEPQKTPPKEEPKSIDIEPAVSLDKDISIPTNDIEPQSNLNLDEPSIPPAFDLPGEPDSPNDIDTEFAGNITPLEAKDLIKRSKGKFFTVSFIKKDGTPRIMNARLGVKAYLKGGELPYDPEEKGLIPVFDVQKKEYRVIPINRIFNLKIGNNEYKVR